MPAELKPCPFCGSDELAIDHYSVGCARCFINGPANSDEEISKMGGYNDKCIEAAVVKWNRRAEIVDKIANGSTTAAATLCLCLSCLEHKEGSCDFVKKDGCNNYIPIVA